MKYILSMSLLGIVFVLSAQDPVLETRPSQRASVTQRIGTTDITIDYHSPLANGRKIFGGLVAYDERINGKPFPWRAGANENTTIRFNHAVSINGQPLAAGVYALHVLVSEDSWTFAFSNSAEGWGSFAYQEEQDALRVKVITRKTEFQDWLSYTFVDLQPDRVGVKLSWEQTSAVFEISTNIPLNKVSDINLMEEKSWKHYQILAESYKELDDLQASEEAVDQAIAIEPHFKSLLLKSEFHQSRGEKKLAKQSRDQAYELADKYDLFSYGMLLLDQKEEKKALQIMELNEKRNPDFWWVYLAYGRFFSEKEDWQSAVDSYSRAYDLVTERGRAFGFYRLEHAKNKLEQSMK